MLLPEDGAALYHQDDRPLKALYLEQAEEGYGQISFISVLDIWKELAYTRMSEWRAVPPRKPGLCRYLQEMLGCRIRRRV